MQWLLLASIVVPSLYWAWTMLTLSSQLSDCFSALEAAPTTPPNAGGSGASSDTLVPISNVFECHAQTREAVRALQEQLSEMKQRFAPQIETANLQALEQQRSELQLDDGARFQKFVRAIQHSHEACSESTLLVHYLNNFQFESDVHTLVYYLTVAVFTNARLVLHAGNWVYTDAEGCPHRGWECYFEPISNCTEADVAPYEMTMWTSDADSAGSRVMKVDWSRWIDTDNGIKSVYDHRQMFDKMPKPFNDQSESFFCANLITYVLRPNQFVLDQLQQLKQKIDFKPQTIGVFVSSAESLRRNERPSYSVKKYINLVQQLNRRHFTKKIFVATDDERLDLSRVASEFPEFEWSFQHRRRLVTDTERAIHVILDLFLLADCEFFVASMAMETPRIVYALSRATSRVKEVASLDSQDKNQWGACVL